jgi:PAS domain S-box-containing protein
MTHELPQESAQELYENAPCGYLSTLPDGTIRKVNQTFLTWTGYTRATLLDGKRFQDLLTMPGRIFHDTHYGPLLQMQGFVNEVAFDLRCPDRAPLPVLVNATQVNDPSGRPLLIRVTIFDATDRRKYEQELLRSRREAEQLAAIVRASSDAILRMTPGGVVQTWNAGAEAMFGYTVQALIILPDRVAEFNELLHRMHAEQTVQLETVCRHKLNKRVDVSISLTPHLEAVEGLTGISSIIRDITARKQAEAALQKLTATLEQRVAERTAELERRNHELDQFVYVASHDLRSPLRAIFNLSSWIHEDAGDLLPAPSRNHLEKLRGRALRMEHLLDDLLAYARIDRCDRLVERVRSAALIQNVVELLAPPSGFEIKIEGELPELLTPRIPLELVFRNLISNAIKHHHLSAEGEVQVSARDLNDFVEFRIRDNGPGIDPKYHARIFELFQTLAPRDKVDGSGMGLALVKKTVEHFGGTIQVDAAAGQGATFRFTWPKALPVKLK